MIAGTSTNGGVRDRRLTSRFPVQEEVTYRLIQNKGEALSGSGITLNIGSGGILFTTQERLPVGRTAEVAVNWPARLDGICPLKMVARGRIIRSESGKAAIRIERYEFRTRRTATAVAVAS